MKEIEVNQENLGRIENEIKILRSFDHYNVVKYIDSFREDKNFYIIMELCELDLNQFINDRNNKLINEKIIYIILKDISYGLKEIHSNNIIIEI